MNTGTIRRQRQLAVAKTTVIGELVSYGDVLARADRQRLRAAMVWALNELPDRAWLDYWDQELAKVAVEIVRAWRAHAKSEN